MLARICRITLPVFILLAALAVYRMLAVSSRTPDVVLPRNVPAAILPRYDDPRVVTDAQLAAVLDRVKPPTDPVTTNNFIHALRLWGPSADFGDAKIPSGRQLRDYFLDDATFRRWAGEHTPPLFYRGKDGIEVRSYDDRLADRQTSSFHTNDLVATLAETGTPLDTPLVLRDGKARVSDLLATALRNAHPDQLEYEWTAIAYARYVFPQPGWRNKYGQKMDVDLLVDQIVRQPPQLGPCNGLHRLEALAVLYRADEQHQMLRPKTKHKTLRYMQLSSQMLVQAQTPDGFWTRQWSRGPAASQVNQANPATLHDKLLVTGHHLEWLALAPEEVQPPRETVVRAAQWLTRTLLEMDEKELQQAYGPYTHAARALCLWRSKEPGEAWSKGFGVQGSEASAASNYQRATR
jgi:hypothetical protein